MGFEEVIGLFMGIAFLIVACVGSYLLYQIIRGIKTDTDYEEKVIVLKSHLIDKVSAKNGINLPKEIEKTKLIQKPTKSFRRRLEDQIYDEMFGKDKEDKEDKEKK